MSLQRYKMIPMRGKVDAHMVLDPEGPWVLAEEAVRAIQKAAADAERWTRSQMHAERFELPE